MNKPLLFALLFFTFWSNAQSLKMYQIGNYAGVNALQYNPSQIAGSKYAWHFNLGLFHTQTAGATLKNEFIPLSGTAIKTSNGTNRSALFTALGPAMMLQTHKAGSFGFFTKYTALQKGNLSLATSDAYHNHSSFKTIGFSYAYQLSYKAHALALGASYLLHSSYAYTQVSLSNSKTLSITSNQYPQSFNIKDILLAKTSTTGVDLGFTYEFRPKHSDYAYLMDGKSRANNATTNYALRIAAALVDNGVQSLLNNNIYETYAKELSATDLKKLDNNEEFYSRLIHIQLEKTKSSTSLQQIFAPNFNINIEGAVGTKGWYMGLFSSKPLNSSNSNLEPFQQGFFGFYPRFQKSNEVQFSAPITYQKETKNLGVGLHLQLGAITFGSEGLNSFFTKKAIAPSFYFGVNFGKIFKKIKDKDGDAVSDRADKCPTLPGVWALKGCPDSDNDGIEDNLDRCPEHAGPKATNGCPDADGDGIFDNMDACPNIAGIAKFNGCPDTDGDGIMDSEDECPTQAGKLEDGGCPDTDGDGIIDSKDNCPTVKGPKENKGCPN